MNAVAERLDAYKELKSNGVALRFTHSTLNSYDTASLSASVDQEIYNTFGIIYAFKDYELDGTNVKRGDRKIIMGVITDMPDPVSNDIIETGGVTWKVIDNEAIAPTGVTILHKVHVR